VWGYSLAWFFFNDRVKLLAYRLLDSPKAAKPNVNPAPAAVAEVVAK
jgi:hypothetical protein